MTEFTHYSPGTFCWVDLGTTDAAAAKRFYAQLFGWKADDMPAGPGMIYTMLSKDGKDVGALYELGEDQRKQGVPPHWLSYVSVASADESAARAKELGAEVLMGPFDVMDVGRMALVRDPTGAVFALWEPKKHIGARLANEPGSLCWNELLTTDTDKAGEFYRSLLGWSSEPFQGGLMPYTIFKNGGRGAGGMMRIAEEWGPVPPNWLVYFAVEECDRTVAQAGNLGARVQAPPTDIPEVGRFSVLQDPQGAVFAVIRPLNPEAA